MKLSAPRQELQIQRVEHMTLADRATDILSKAIMNGTYPHGSQLPPETELISLLGVSRTTVREALRSLEEQEIIVRRRGLGTFVNEKPILKDLSRNFGLTEMISQAGFIAGTSSADLREEKASSLVANKLQLPENELSVIIVDRVRTANEQPVVWSIDSIPRHFCGTLNLKNFNAHTGSIYNFLADILNIRIVQGAATIKPILSTKEMANRLQIKEKEPLLEIAQVDYNDNNLPVLFTIEYHLSDKFLFVVHRKGPSW